jgi:hypothetical protein
MGRLRNFKKLKWKPFQIREENISVTNYWVDKRGRKCPTQEHLDIPRFSHFEILRWHTNPHYGKEQEYRDNGYVDSFGGDFLQSPTGSSIQKTFFTKPESCYMIASWQNMDHDEKTPDLKFVGSRPLEIDEEEWSTFLRIAKAGQAEIERQLNNFNEEGY